MINNIKLFEISIKNKEPYVDKYYVKSNKPIITDDSKKLNKLMKANADILDNKIIFTPHREYKNSLRTKALIIL